MKKTEELAYAIDNLYATFSAYPLRDDTNACSCCHAEHDEQRIHLKPLRKLKTDDLRQYATDALNVLGDEADFKHFLPRIFELEVEYGDDFLDPQLALTKLSDANWRYWSQSEQGSVGQFLRAAWRSVIHTEPYEWYGMEIDDWLCGIAQAESTLSDYLADWLATDERNVQLSLAAFIADTDFAKPNAQPGAYWGGRGELFDQVAQWVRSDTVKARLSTVAAKYPEYDFVERAYVALV